MGANTFVNSTSAKDAKTAFDSLVRQAQYEDGHGGYTGTIAEKRSFTMIPLPAGKEIKSYINELIAAGDRRIDDKWGPAGCIDAGPDPKTPGNRIFVFFGWASS